MSDIVTHGGEAWTRAEWERVHGAEAGSPDGADLTVDEQFRRDVEADRIAAEARDADEGDTRTPKDHLQRSAEKLRASLGDISAEAAAHFEGLLLGINKIAEVRVIGAAPISEPEPAEEPEPEPVVQYDDVPAAMAVRLTYPLTVDDVRIDQINLRPPSFRDVRAVVTGAIPEIEMQANMAGVTVGALRALRWPDMEAVTMAARHLAPEMEH